MVRLLESFEDAGNMRSPVWWKCVVITEMEISEGYSLCDRQWFISVELPETVEIEDLLYD